MSQIERLRTLIRESVKDHIKEIEAVAEAAAMEARLAEYDKAIKTCESKIESAENLEEVKELVDEGKLNELKKKLKDLKKTKEKLEKQKAKKNKGKEVTTDAETDNVDEATDKMDETYVEETYTMDEMSVEEEMKEEALNESFLKMQKLAGIITEGQYQKKIQPLLENISNFKMLLDKIPNEKYFSELDNIWEEFFEDGYGNDIDAAINDGDIIDYLYDSVFNDLKGKPGVEGNNWNEFLEASRREYNSNDSNSPEMLVVKKITDVLKAYSQKKV